MSNVTMIGQMEDGQVVVHIGATLITPECLLIDGIEAIAFADEPDDLYYRIERIIKWHEDEIPHMKDADRVAASHRAIAFFKGMQESFAAGKDVVDGDDITIPNTSPMLAGDLKLLIGC